MSNDFKKCEVKKDFIVLDVLSNYIVVKPENGEIDLMSIDDAISTSKEVQIGRIIDTGNTTKKLISEMKDSIDSILNVTFDFLSESEVDEVKEFGVCFDRLKCSFEYDKEPINSIIGEFVVFDKMTNSMITNENGEFVIHSYDELNEYTDFLFADVSKNTYDNLEETLEKFNIISNYFEEITLRDDIKYIDKIDENLHKMLNMYSSNKDVMYK